MLLPNTGSRSVPGTAAWTQSLALAIITAIAPDPARSQFNNAHSILFHSYTVRGLRLTQAPYPGACARQCRAASPLSTAEADHD